MPVEVEDFIAHYGKKGMRWGVINKDTSVQLSRAPGQPGKKISKHRTRLEAEYIKKGFTKNQAAVKADRKIKTEIVLGAVAGVAATAAIGYGVKVAYGKRFTDVVLEQGHDLHYINAIGGDKVDLDRRLYTTFQKSDTDIYRGLMRGHLERNSVFAGSTPDKTVMYDTVLKATEKIKAPSHVQAQKMFSEWAVDQDLPMGTTYKNFNRMIVADMPETKEFMNHLKSKGYNALLDSNDQFISGFGAKKPLIVFNAASSLVKSGESIVSKQTSKRLTNIHTAKLLAKQYAPYVGLGAGAVALGKASDTHDKYQVVSKYIDTHPETKRSYAEIYASLRASHDGTGYITRLKD